MSIYSGLIGNEKINCYKAYEEGVRSLNLIIDNDSNFGSVKFQRKNKILSLKTVQSSVKINDEIVAINPLLFFQRISLKINSPDDMKEYLRFELAPFPLSLFTEHGLRKNKITDL